MHASPQAEMSPDRRAANQLTPASRQRTVSVDSHKRGSAEPPSPRTGSPLVVSGNRRRDMAIKEAHRGEGHSFGGLTHVAQASHPGGILTKSKLARAPGVCTTAPIPVFPVDLLKPLPDSPLHNRKSASPNHNSISGTPSPRRTTQVSKPVQESRALNARSGAKTVSAFRGGRASSQPKSPAHRVKPTGVPPSPGRGQLSGSKGREENGQHPAAAAGAGHADPTSRRGIMVAMHRTAVTTPDLLSLDLPLKEPAEAEPEEQAQAQPAAYERAEFVMGSAEPLEPAMVVSDSPRRLKKLHSYREVDIVYRHKPVRGTSPQRRRPKGDRKPEITIQALTPQLERSVYEAHVNGTLACLDLFDLRSFSYAKGCPSSVISCKVALAGWISELLERHEAPLPKQDADEPQQQQPQTQPQQPEGRDSA